MRALSTVLISTVSFLLLVSASCREPMRSACWSNEPCTVPVAAVEVTPPSASIAVGARVSVRATPLDGAGTPLVNRSVSWASSNPSVAAVSPTDTESSEVVGIASGNATITATSESKSSVVVVTVTQPSGPAPIDTVVVAPLSASVNPGQTIQLTASAKDASGSILAGRAIVWSSSNTSIAGVSTAGLVTAVSPGIAGITAASEGKHTTATITVMTPPPEPVASVHITPQTASVVVGQTVQLSATPKSANGTSLTGRAITWASSNAALATVSSTGLVTGVSDGSVTITATSEGKSGTASVTVTPVPAAPVATVDVTPATGSVMVGQTVQLTATPKDASGNPLTGRVISWSSANAAVATVSSGGLVSGVTVGSTTISATSEGRSGTATIAVNAASASECATPRPGWIWCDDFEQDRLSRYFEYDAVGGNFVRATGVGVGGSMGMRGRWTVVGQTEATAGSLKLAFGRTPQAYFRPVDAGTADYREIYWRLYVRHQPGWVGGGADKMSRATVFASNSTWAQAMIAHVWSGQAPGPHQNLLVIDPATGTDDSGNLVTTKYNDFANLRWLGAARSTTPIFDANHVGQWYCVEARVKLNDAGQANGIFQMWINGTLEAQKTGLNWLGAFNAYGINAVFVENYWNAGTPQPQERYFDGFIVSTQPIGC
jgi:uncharacterized protein YjdB